MRCLAVGGGVNIFAAGEHQSVQAVQHSLSDAGIYRLWRQQRRHTAGRSDTLEVGQRKKAGTDVPNPGLRLVQIGCQADHRRLSDPHASTVAQARSYGRRTACRS
jgi:hypothetical protein